MDIEICGECGVEHGLPVAIEPSYLENNLSAKIMEAVVFNNAKRRHVWISYS